MGNTTKVIWKEKVNLREDLNARNNENQYIKKKGLKSPGQNLLLSEWERHHSDQFKPHKTQKLHMARVTVSKAKRKINLEKIFVAYIINKGWIPWRVFIN